LDVQWKDYLEDCGKMVIIENNVKAAKIFEEKYKGNVIEWEGYFVYSYDGGTYILTENKHKLNFFIKMDNTESLTYPDLILSIGENYYRDHRTMIKSIENGDGLSFKASFEMLGDEFQLHHLHSVELKKTGKSKDLSNILHTKVSYQFFSNHN
jgi:hypothetical protein